jgi:hypothetical protein
VTVAIGADLWMRAMSARAPVRRWVLWLLVVPVLGWGVGTRGSWLEERVGLERDWRGDHECGAGTPAGYRTRDVAAWLADLPPGRFVVDAPSFSAPPGLACPSLHGLELSSTQPLGGSAGGPGSQNGSINDAFEELRLSEPGADARAEALGIRTVLHTRAHRPAGDWHVLEARGDVELSARGGASGIMGVGCVRRVWRGSDRAIHERLLRADAWPSVLDSPKRLVAVELTPAGFEDVEVDPGACDESGAVITELAREPGAYAADLRAAHDVDVVVRAAAFPTWRVWVDGEVTPTRLVAPGFFAARVGAGSHRIEARVSPLPYYRAGLAAWGLAIVALGVLARRDRRAAPA